jgi:hypothetical protein
MKNKNRPDDNRGDFLCRTLVHKRRGFSLHNFVSIYSQKKMELI